MIGPKLDAGAAAMNAAQSEELKHKLGLDQLRRNLSSGKAEEKKLREACEGFEAVFMNKLWKQMRQNVPQDGYLHSKEEKFYVGMFDQKLSEKMAAAGGMGLGDMLFEQLREQLVHKSASTRVAHIPAEELNPLRGPQKEVNTEIQRTSSFSLPHKPARDLEIEGTGGVNVADNGPGRVAAPAQPTAPEATMPSTVGPVAASRVEASPELMSKAMELAVRIEYEHMRTESAPAAPKLLAENSPAPGTLVWPAQGEVTTGYGWRTDPLTGAQEMHSGVDIAGQPGDSVTSCWDGKVVFAGDRGRYGQTVVIEHADGWRSMYGHTEKISVREGQTVKAGEKIATMGSTAGKDGTNIHFEVRHGGQAVNPETLRSSMQASRALEDY
ncbi:peptidoglycan DD-metalloendopeptidase family protein [Desulfobaculum bizertense]|uniref:Rod binding protein n=1 Tax=Desulfobaculum bizertense DSM 18034 TaxID=1121442 RepID=A0A1T4W6F2_9BACT|nr:peptidoglycan DD-metalloendopeptidase family protein [Desulfobaculum bizertense]UIJ39048.1 peptidoglycan DD-metalloendopeptidase family protein [Desulfobaculum bizertense]SKA72884.1 Rod binding protein [Desulfobaculum bizertense DSM 18034]